MAKEPVETRIIENIPKGEMTVSICSEESLESQTGENKFNNTAQIVNIPQNNPKRSTLGTLGSGS